MSDIDFDRLTESASFVEMTEIELLSLFRESIIESVLPLLLESVDNLEYQSAESYCHRIKSHCRNIGLMRCMKAASDSENYFLKNEPQKAASIVLDLVSNVKADYELIRESLIL